MSAHRLMLIPIHKLIVPREGDVMLNRWWVARDGCAIFYQSAGDRGWSPQCNSHLRMVEDLIRRLYPGAGVAMVPAAYLGRWDYLNGHMLGWADKSWIETGAEQ